MGAMFFPLNYRQVWTTGLPLNDFLTQAEGRLPAYIGESLKRIRCIKGERKLIVYAPTYRQTDISSSAHYYQFSDVEIKTLKSILLRNNAILGYRPHYFKNSDKYFNLDRFVDNELIFDVSQSIIPEFSALARELDLLVTDYSSVYIEALYVGKPVVCFGYDIDHYTMHEDGLLYDMNLAFPGPVARHFEELTFAIEERLNMPQSEIEKEQATAKRIFYKYNDEMNCRRVVDKVMELVSEK